MNQVSFENDPDDEQLLAYLDGDLSEGIAKSIDERLKTDPGLRRRLDELRTSWDMLDELPVSVSNPKLAESTIELVALRLMEERKTSSLQKILRLRWPLIGIATMLAFLLGAWTAVRQVQRQVEELVGTLPVVTRYSEIKLIDRPEWLERLARVDSLIEAGLPLIEGAAPATGVATTVVGQIPNADSENSALDLPTNQELPRNRTELSRWLTELDKHQQRRLYEDYQAFQTTAPKRKAILRKIAEMSDGKNLPDYSEFLKAYAGLVSAIPSTEFAQIAAIQDLDQRAEWIQSVVYRELAIDYAGSLNETELRNIRDWANDLKERHFDYFLTIEDPDSEIILMLESTSIGPSGKDSNVESQEDMEDLVIDSRDVARLIDSLSGKGRSLLEQLAEGQRSTALSLWVHAALPTTRPRPKLSAEQLQRKFRALPLERQNELIYLPAAEVIKALN